ncbi:MULTISPECIES: biotin synthase BioB [Brevibacillus]|jgi:biotin synthetase|uniref:biotin synthase BioB n=1 Tax=Brevibacillus TaxID=55080 RepID=UPI000EC62F74|nr:MULTISPECIES: biotin synthase BioB [Brevibacillus]MDH6350963.1 biotin synthase [Brevibacillus sp. 1238]MDR4997790.1 biotin synthase BioB [Brevibacillus parabrevis]MED2256085.1 biotin synthase BioB [Brevibacillus parabrevis]WDV95043.1 biotin synthase BioB [Brevibacillus parabrevis]HBZ81838.1 biotin synthase BioB [Brevibacillus sp.]
MSRTVVANWNEYAGKAVQKEALTLQEALCVLRAPDDELLPLLHAAFQVRKHFFGKKVKLNMILNAKSGLCPEDCGYCSQSIVSTAPVAKYTMLDKETLLAGAKEAMNRKAGTYCIVASGRGPTEKELGQVIEAVQEIRDTMPLKICACLGILSDEQAKRLKEAGVHRYNHNLNTSRNHYAAITTTHTYEQRVGTVDTVKKAGMSPCSGVIIGMGESDEEIAEMAFALRSLDADSIPVNFLNAIPGTPLEHQGRTQAQKALKVLALFRFVCPDKEIRVAGGREVNLRSLQPLSLYAANSLFVGDYLTTPGQEITSDHQMIEDLGFEIELCAL